MGTPQERIEEALKVVTQYGGTDGDHHKAWVIDQMVRALTGCPMVEKSKIDVGGFAYTYLTRGESEEYVGFVKGYCEGEDGPETYEWNTGIAP